MCFNPIIKQVICNDLEDYGYALNKNYIENHKEDFIEELNHLKLIDTGFIYNYYCKKNEVHKSFEELIKNAKFEYIFLSYNNEGLMSEKEVKNIMSKYGKYDLKIKKYQRFKADKSENRNHKADLTYEYLHILQKDRF